MNSGWHALLWPGQRSDDVSVDACCGLMHLSMWGPKCNVEKVSFSLLGFNQFFFLHEEESFEFYNLLCDVIVQWNMAFFI